MTLHFYELYTTLLKQSKVALLVVALIVVAPVVTNAQITLGVTFGTSQNDGTPCVGKGVCKESLVVDHTSDQAGDPNPEAVSVTFQVSPDNPNVLMMSFLLSELKTKQPDQVPFFTNATGSYIFDVAYPLSSSNLASLSGLPDNATIATTSNSTIVINGDIVTDYITLSTTN